MTNQGELFGSRQQPAVHKPKEKKAPLFERMLELFKSRKYGSFQIRELVETFPEHRPDIVQQALHKLIRNGDVKALPSLDRSDPVRYTVTIYKS